MLFSMVLLLSRQHCNVLKCVQIKKDKKTYLPENKKNCDALSESDARADQKLLYFFVWPYKWRRIGILQMRFPGDLQSLRPNHYVASMLTHFMMNFQIFS